MSLAAPLSPSAGARAFGEQDLLKQPSPPPEHPRSNRRSRLPTIWTLQSSLPLQKSIPLSQSNPLTRLVYASVLNPKFTPSGEKFDNVPAIQSFVSKANERNPHMNIGGWLYVDESVSYCEQVLEGPRSSVERLFYGRRVTDKNGSLKGKDSWVGGICGDPAHTVKKVFQMEVEEGGQRVYEHWGMSWAITNIRDDSNGGSSRRLAKIEAKQPVYGKWLSTGKDKDLVEDCDGREEVVWNGKGERVEPEEGDVVEADGVEEGGRGRRLRIGSIGTK
mmetsp:Transcript_23580/g.44346  ORF Transcript_23580/g.44346 Transcript_23580/m.44346 type:complete len:276 (-) Transcript_23580:65-892(-)